MERAADAYGPVRMTLESRFRPVTLMATMRRGLIDQAKTLLGRTRPSGVDIVYVLTNKNIQLGGNTAVARLPPPLRQLRPGGRSGGARAPRAHALHEHVQCGESGFAAVLGREHTRGARARREICRTLARPASDDCPPGTCGPPAPRGSDRGRPRPRSCLRPGPAGPPGP
jgi:hypothetical protein